MVPWFKPTSQGSVIPDSGIFRYTFNDTDTSGSTALDVWNNNDGTINGATTGVTGANQTYSTAEAYSFDDTDDNVLAPSWGVLSNISVAGWARADDTADTDQLFGFNDDAPGVLIRLNAGGVANDVRFFVGGSTTADITASISDTTVWNHYTLTASENGTVYAYVNGSQVGSASVGSFEKIGTASSGDNNYIGSSRSGGSVLGGDIDDPRVYSKQLSGVEVSDLYNTGSIL